MKDINNKVKDSNSYSYENPFSYDEISDIEQVYEKGNENIKDKSLYINKRKLPFTGKNSNNTKIHL